jgi:hypothetical protein
MVTTKILKLLHFTDEKTKAAQGSPHAALNILLRMSFTTNEPVFRLPRSRRLHHRSRTDVSQSTQPPIHPAQ